MVVDKKTALIGIGNLFRRDDGVGINIVRELKQRLSDVADSEIDFLECSGEGTELMDNWEGYHRVYLFDAVMLIKQVGKVYRLHANDMSVSSDFFKYSSHAFSLAEAIELARVLGRLPRELIVYGIEGEDFGHGEGLSPALAEAVQVVTERVINEFDSNTVSEEGAYA